MRNKAAYLTFTALVLALCVPFQGAGRTSQDTGAVSEPPALSVEAMKEDLKVLLDVLEEGHGGFDRYTPAGDLRKILDGNAAGYPRDRGIVPDFSVEPTIEDLLAGRDPVMDRALIHLEKKRP